MKPIIIDKKIEQEENDRAERKELEMEAMKNAISEFRLSSAYPYVMKFFKEQEDRIINEIESIQNDEIKKVFMLPATKQREKIAEMSKRDAVLTGVLSIIKNVKNKL
jgi:hypothetical protein